jgi:hypothetical protein
VGVISEAKSHVRPECPFLKNSWHSLLSVTMLRFLGEDNLVYRRLLIVTSSFRKKALKNLANCWIILKQFFKMCNPW